MESKENEVSSMHTCLLGRLTPKLSRAAKRHRSERMLNIIAEHW